MSHVQMQGLQILAATNLELQTQIQTALETNPVLELVSPGNELLVGDPMQVGLGNRDEDTAASLVEHDENLNDNLLLDYAGNDAGIDESYLPAARNEDDEERRRHFFDSLTTEANMYASLAEQAYEVCGDDQALRDACDAVLGNLDDNGYLRATDQELAQTGGISLELAAKAVSIVQGLEPAGIGARTPRECLLLQMARLHEQGGVAWDIVDKHLEDLSRNRIPLIAKALGTDVEDVNEAVERIRELEPFPGRMLSNSASPTVIPEATIYRGEDGLWHVAMNRDACPTIAISGYYSELADDKNQPKEARSYLRGKIREGEQLIQALDQRASTLEKITVVLADWQQDFLEGGVGKLRPMVMADVAQALDLHETTVSRAVANKYVRTPHGVYEYKFFFAVGYSSSADGEELSSRAIREKIRELISKENPEKPLSDQKLAELLAKDGLTVARRTVAKYREAEGIPATSLRKVH